MPRLFALIVLAAFAPLAVVAAAEPPRPRDLLPEQPVLVVELNEPATIVGNSLVQNVWNELKQSAELQRRTEAPEFDRLRQLEKFVETATGQDWKSALETLTKGGVALAVAGEPGAPPEFTAVVSAADEAVLRQVIDAAQSAILSRIAEDRRPAKLPGEPHRDVACYHVGNAYYAVVGKRLLLANRRESLQAMIDRLFDWKPAIEKTPDGSDAKSANARSSAPLLRGRLDLVQLRKSPELAKPLTLPGNDIGLLFLFGGWIDVLSRASSATAEIQFDDKAIDTRLAFAAGRDEVRPGLAGFFATKAGARALPPLKIPGTIASVSWYRDYSSLWSNRQHAVSPEAKQRLEDGNDQAKRQLEVLGARFTPAELLSDLGTHFRVVVARQDKSAYQLELPEKLPAAAFLVDMRNTGLRDKLTPLLRFTGIIAAADGRRMATLTETYKSAELTSLRFREDTETVASGSRVRYQFSPTYGFVRNHFVVGSTSEIVRQVIDALEAQESSETVQELAEFTTEASSIQPAAVAAALGDFRSALLNSTVLNNGISLGEAEQELGVLMKSLSALRGLESKITFDKDRLEVRVRAGD